MRAFVFWGLTLSYFFSVGAPVPKTDPPPVKANFTESHQFSYNVSIAISNLQYQKYRDFEKADLWEAALKAVYEMAKTPIPADTVIEFNKLRKDKVEDYKFQSFLREERMKLPRTVPLLEGKDTRAALRAILAKVDWACQLVEDMSPTDQSRIGFVFANGNQSFPFPIFRITPGSPAQKAGLRMKDEILEIDGNSVAKLTLSELTTKLSGGASAYLAPEGEVKIKVWREGEKEPLSFTIKRYAYEIENVLGVSRRRDDSWNFYLDLKNKIALIRLGVINVGTAEELSGVLGKLKAEMKGLILDLRGTTYGYMEDTMAIPNLFFKDKFISKLVSTAAPQGRRETIYKAEGTPVLLDTPLIVLVKQFTSGAGEIIASALSDSGRGILVGEQTRGSAVTGSEIRVSSLPPLNARVVSGEFFRADGKTWHKKPDAKRGDDYGLIPNKENDFFVPKHIALAVAQGWEKLTQQPGHVDQATDMHDPERNDPLAFVALRKMRKLLKVD